MEEQEVLLEAPGTEADQSTDAAQATEGEAPATPPEQEAQAAEEKERHNRYQDLIYRRKEAERQAEAARMEAAELRRQLEERAQDKATPQFSSEPPDINDFESVTEWQKANLAWQQRELLSLVARDREEQQRRQAAAEAAREWEHKRTTFQSEEQKLKASLGPEGAQAYDAAVNRLDAFLLDPRGAVLPNAQPLFQALFEAGPKVAHALAEDLELAARLSQADPLTVGIEIGRLAARVQDGGRQGRRFSQAPPPETVLAGARAAAGARDYASMNGSEYAAARRAEEEAARQARMAR